MMTDQLSINLWIVALRVARGWYVERLLPAALDVPQVFRPRAKA